jgi:hypothetical protein
VDVRVLWLCWGYVLLSRWYSSIKLNGATKKYDNFSHHSRENLKTWKLPLTNFTSGMEQKILAEPELIIHNIDVPSSNFQLCTKFSLSD